MRTADGHLQRTVAAVGQGERFGSGGNLRIDVFRFGVCLCIAGAEGAEVGVGKVYPFAVRYVYHPEDGPVVGHEGDVHREFAVALDELHRSVQRVYHPEEVPVLALGVEHFASLLAEERDACLAEILPDDGVGQAVGHRDRRPVALDVHIYRAAAVVDVEYRGPGPDGRVVCLGQQVFLLFPGYHKRICCIVRL